MGTRIQLLILSITLILRLSAEENFISYHRDIVIIEELILQEDYSKTLTMYDGLFEKFNKPFAKDLYNASICASMVKDTLRARNYINKLSKVLINKDLLSNKNFKFLKKCSDYKSFEIQILGNINQHEEQLRSDTLLGFLNKLQESDQLFRKKSGSYRVWGDTIAKIDSMNIKRLKSYIEKNGYPNERDLGLSNPLELSSPYIVLRHAYQTKNYALSNLLWKEVIKGNLHPYIYTELEDKKSNWEGYGDKYGTLAIFKVQGKERETIYSSERIDTLNNNRSNIGLETYDSYKVKIRAYRFDKKFQFWFFQYEGLIVMSGLKLKDFDRMYSKDE